MSRDQLLRNTPRPLLSRSVERATRAVLFVDVVKYVRLVEQDEESVVSRWLSFAERVEADVLPACHGRLVQRFGDGLLLEFHGAQAAVRAAFAIQHASRRENAGEPLERQILLRMGIEVSDVFIDRQEVFGHGVNLAARLTTLAGPGEIVISAHVRDQLTPALDTEIEDILGSDEEIVSRLVADVSSAVTSRKLKRVRSQSLPTLKSYSLLMGAIGLMHRMSLEDFEEAHLLLQALIDRATRQSVAYAWLAHWYVLRVQQGWSSDQQRDSCIALECTRRALDTNPECSLALAIDGAVHTSLLKRLDVAEERYRLALAANPNNALAWMLKGTMHAFSDQGSTAVQCTEMGLRLSPLDPHRYYYDSLAASARLTAGQYENARALAERSLRANRSHTSTLRVLAVAQWHSTCATTRAPRSDGCSSSSPSSPSSATSSARRRHPIGSGRRSPACYARPACPIEAAPGRQ